MSAPAGAPKGGQQTAPAPAEHAKHKTAEVAGQQQENKPPGPPCHEEQKQTSLGLQPIATCAAAAAPRTVPRDEGGKGSKRKAPPSVSWEPQYAFSTPAKRAKAEVWHAVWMRRGEFCEEVAQRVAHAFGEEQDLDIDSVKGMADAKPLHEAAFPAGFPATLGTTVALNCIFANIKAR